MGSDNYSNSNYTEFHDPDQFPGDTSKKRLEKRRRKIAGAVATISVAAAATALVSMSSFTNVSLAVNMIDFRYEDGYFKYDFNVVNLDSGKNATFLIQHENDTLNSITISANGEYKGNIPFAADTMKDYLAAGKPVTFTFRVQASNGLFSSNVDFGTYSLTVNEVASKFNEITYQSTYKENSYLTFRIDFRDDYQRYSDFYIYLTDMDDHQYDCNLEDKNVHDPQTIFVGAFDGYQGTLHVEYKENGLEKEILKGVIL